MSRSNTRAAKKSSAARDNYHHGDLRRSLLDAARGLAEERGIDGFTLREVARRAGVSHAAPYHHFADKAALVEGLAVETYERLAQALGSAAERRGGNAAERLCAIGIGYVQFVVAHPAECRLLNRFALCEDPMEGPLSPVKQAAGKAYGVLIGTILEGQQAGLIQRQPEQNLALACWAAVHGLAVLILDGLINKAEYAGMQPPELAEIVVDRLFHGLGTEVARGAERASGRS